MIHLYRYLIAPLFILLLPFIAITNRKVAEGLRLRRQRRLYPELALRPIWIHASSGEFEYAKSVIRELKKRYPHIPVVVTYFSPTYAQNVKNFPGVDFAMPLPLDLPGPMRSFLRRLHPRALLLARTDFWPEMLSQTRRLDIPIHVFSYTQRDPRQMGFIARFIAAWRLKMVDQIHAVSAEDLAHIQTLGEKTPAQLLGDTRYDQVRFRLDHPKELPQSLKPEPGPLCLVAGSTWPEDEQVLLPAVQPLLRAGTLKLILVPHEPTAQHIADLKRQLEAHGISFALFSQDQPWADRQVLLVDQVGWLAELYAWGDIAFVGGSFRKTVHSVMEALGAGLKTFVGPLHTNNREAIEFQNILCAGIPAVTAVASQQDFTRELQDLSREKLIAFRAPFTREFAARLGATDRLLKSVPPALLL